LRENGAADVLRGICPVFQEYLFVMVNIRHF
jgi:hypothetical protein